MRRSLLSMQGVALITALLMLVAVAMLGLSAAQLALQGEKSSRNDRDHQIAFQAAEAALLDAELDIRGSSVASRSRSGVFSPLSTQGFVPGCGKGANNRFLGLCESSATAVPDWQLVDLQEVAADKVRTVAYGTFTGQVFPTGSGGLPSQLPRYLIEILPDRIPGLPADSAQPRFLYRITAIGFGMRPQTQVVLQSFYRKAG